MAEKLKGKIPAREERIFSLPRETVKAETRTVDLAFSSEEPVVRYWGIEVLDHSPGAMRSKRMKGEGGLPLLFNHNRDLLLGRLRGCKVDRDDRKGRGTAHFDDAGEGAERFRQIEAGILSDVSVGYEVHFVKEVPTKELSPDLVELSARTKLPVYRITDWEPFECSLVTVPADPTVGVGRAEEIVPGESSGAPAVPAPVVEIIQAKEERKMGTEPTKGIAEYEADVQKARDESGKVAREHERLRVQGINDIYEKFKAHVPEFLRRKAVDEGMQLQDFQDAVLKRLGNGQPIDTPASEIGLSNAEVRRYSISKALLSQWRDSGVDAGFEMACHKEIEKRLGDAPRKGGIFVPYEVLRQPADGRGTRGYDGRRDLTAGTGSAGGFLIGTDNLGGEFIDLLRNNMLIRKLGARVLSGLKGNVTIPKRTAGAVSYWVGESTAPTEGANTFAQLSLSPKNVGANLDYTRNLLLQSNPSIDALVNGDLALSLATAIDLAAFHGSGGAGQPQGIVGTSGVGSVTCTTIGTGTLSKILEFQTDIAANNALAGNCAYVTTPAVAAILKAQVLYASTASPAWEGGILGGQMVGFPAFSSNQITTGYMIFGDFSQVILAEWGSLELVVDPYTQSKNGIIQVTAFQTIDVGVRYGGAFSVTTSVAT